MTTIDLREAAFRLQCQDGQPTLLSVSQSVQDVLGYDAKGFEAGAVTLPQLIHRDDHDVASLLFSPLAQNPEGDCNLRLRHASGRIVCVKGHYRREPDGHGVVLDLLLQDAKTLPRTLVDVDHSTFAAAVMENTEDYLYSKDRNHVFTAASQTLVGLTTRLTHWQEFIGLTDYDVFPEESADSFYRLEKQVFAGVPIAQEVQETISKDGTKGWVDNRKYPIHDASGTIIGLHGIARDITVAKNAEAALRASEARARSIIEASPVPMATNDQGLRVNFVNPAFTRTFGYDLSDIPTLADWWPKAYPDPVYREWVMNAWQAELTRADQTGTPFEPLEIRVRCKDGSERVTLATAAPIDQDFSRDYLVLMQDVTAFKQAERALQESEERWRFAVDGAGDGAWDWDLASGAVRYSPRWYEMLGYEEHEIAPTIDAWNQLAHPDDAAAVLTEVQKHFDGHTSSSSNEYRMRCKDGTWKWILGRGLVVARDANGVALRMIGTNSDITARKQSELELSKSKQALAEAQRIARLGSWELDTASGEMTLSDELSRILEFDPALPSPSLAEHEALYTPESWIALRESIVQAQSTGRPYEVELERRMRDGSQGWLWARGEALRDEHGVVVGLRGVAQDITERKRAEAALRLSDLAIRSISQGIVITGPDRRIMSVNDAFHSITGYSEQEALGRDCGFLTGPLTDPLTTAAIHAAMASSTSFSGEVQHHRKDGTAFWNEVSILPVFDAQGALTHFIGVIRDVTSRKQMELENAAIEAQLQQSQRLETVGTLAAGIAHDFNNILAAIVGNAELAVVDLDPEHPARENLGEIQKASARAKALVQQVLAFSSQHPQPRHPLALGPLIIEASALLRATIPAAVQITTTVDADAPNVLADASQMHQILINLCTNAWHALENRPGTIEVQLTSVTLTAKEASEVGGLAPGRYARLSVRDSGKGMDDATRQRIFDPFFTTKAPGKGTGLGLSVVHGIMNAHKGAIHVASRPGEGSTFSLYFPASEAAVAVDAPGTSAVQGSADVSGHILYLDDEDMLVRVAKRTLQRHGYRVTGFLNPTEALQAFASDPSQYDAVITDMNMPEIDGLAVAREVRKIRPDIPTVLVSGSIDEALRAAAAEVGISGILCKPFTIQELGDAVAGLGLGS